jgi:hypothetical protein
VSRFARGDSVWYDDNHGVIKAPAEPILRIPFGNELLPLPVPIERVWVEWDSGSTGIALESDLVTDAERKEG